jgi:SAM-dependent methyltransferase
MIGSAKTFLKAKFPSAWNFARTTNKLRKLIPRVYGYEPRTCTLCGHHGRFHAEVHFPDIFVFDAICPACGSNTRNRLLKLAIDRKGLLKPDARLLHFAPEGPVRRVLEPAVGRYATADLFAEGVDLKLNIEAIDQPDGSWDVIVCSHVLEHVDHVKALAELHRILAPGGRLLAMFPVVEAWEGHYENPAVTDERGRALHFGKENHLRRFGGSVRDEFAAAGFDVEAFAPIGPEIVECGLIPGEVLFIATRP